MKEKSISASEIGLALLLSGMLCASYAVYAGQDINWDQKNYHVYSIYALLNDRFGYDIAASQLQTWINPLGSFLQYFMIFGASPVVASIGLAILAAPTVSLVYLLSSRVFAPTRTADWRSAVLLNSASALGAITAPMFLSELGTTFNDHLIWLFTISAIVIFLSHRDRAISLFFAGALLGIAVGLKLTALVYVFGFAVAVLVDDIRRTFRRAIPLAIGFLLSFGLFGGIWMSYVYKLFGNPIFPIYNDIFRSPDYSPSAMLDLRFVPKGIGGVWQHITGIAYGAHPTAEVPFSDLRLLLCIIVVGLSLPQLVGLMFLGRGQRAVSDQVVNWIDARFVLLFTIASFAYWILKFGIERYAIGIEQLAVLCILCGVAALTDDRARTVTAAIMTAGVILTTTSPANWGRTNFSGSWFDMKIPEELVRPNVLFVMLGGEPTAFVIPFLPSSSRFVRIEGNMPITPQQGLGRKLVAIIEKHTGEVRTLSQSGRSLDKSIPSLQLYGLVPADGPCLRIESKAGNVESCPLRRAMH